MCAFHFYYSGFYSNVIIFPSPPAPLPQGERGGFSSPSGGMAEGQERGHDEHSEAIQFVHGLKPKTL